MDIYGLRRVPFLSRYNYLHEFHHVLAWGVVVGMVEGSFASIIVAKTFQGSNLLISIATATPMAMHVVSLFWGALSVGRRKLSIFTFCTTGTALALASIALTPDARYGGWLFVLQMAVAQFFQSGAVTVRSALWKSNYPLESRGQIAGQLQIARAVTRLGAVALIAEFFDADPQSYRWVYPGVAIIGGLGVLALSKMHVRGEVSELCRMTRGEKREGALTERASMTQIVSSSHVLTSAVRVLKNDIRFRKYCIAQMYAGVTNLLVKAVIVVVLTQQILNGMDRAYRLSTVLLEILPMLLMLSTMRACARYYDRAGVVRFRTVQMLGWVVAIFLGMCACLSIENMDVLGPNALLLSVGFMALFGIVRGVCLGGGSIAWNLGHLHFANKDDAEVYMGIHVSLTGLRALVIPLVGMSLWSWIGSGVWLVSIASGLAAIYYFRSLELQDRKSNISPTGATEIKPSQSTST